MDTISVSVQSLQRAGSLIELLSRHPAGLTLGEIAMRSKLHKSTAHRLLGSLIAMGYVCNRNRYRLTTRMFEIGCRAVNSVPIYAQSMPVLRDLSVRTGEDAFLSVIDGDEGLCVYTVKSPTASAHTGYLIGTRFPLYGTASGKAILSTWPDQDARALWSRLPAQPYTPRTAARPGDFLNELQRVRTQGYAVNIGELDLGVAFIACAPTGAGGTSNAAVSVSCAMAGLSARRLSELSEAVKEARDRLGALS